MHFARNGAFESNPFNSVDHGLQGKQCDFSDGLIEVLPLVLTSTQTANNRSNNMDCSKNEQAITAYNSNCVMEKYGVDFRSIFFGKIMNEGLDASQVWDLIDFRKLMQGYSEFLSTEKWLLMIYTIPKI
jgi:hypothetical protein